MDEEEGLLTKKFHLKTSEILQGDFKLNDLNLMLVFQVNCPGCFIHALPAANKIAENYQAKGLKVLGLSTAFEDFEHNTLDNTKRLLQDGTIVGETKKALNKAGQNKFPAKLQFDIAFDDLQKSDQLKMKEQIDQFAQSIPDYAGKNDVEKKLMQAQIKEYLSNKTMNAFTFDSNFLMGTPSWILFDRDFNILFEFFGHKEYEAIEALLNQHIR